MRRCAVLVLALVLATGCGFEVSSAPRPSDASGDTTDGQGDAMSDGIPNAMPDAMIDARVCPAAPSGCTSFACAGSSSCYYVCTATDWNQARKCMGTLGCIATINSAEENACITGATSPMYPDLVWFGFRQSSSGVEPAGSWSWECESSTFVAPNWGAMNGEPNNQGNEDCGYLGGDGAWFDGGCSTALRYVCELP